MCDFKTKLIQELKNHTKMHERNVCNTITVGTAHKTNHEEITHEKEGEGEHSHPVTKPPAISKKGWVQPKKHFINRKVKKLQREGNNLNKDSNIFNTLLNIPETPDIQKIK